MGKRSTELPDKTSLEYQKAQDSAEHYNNMVWTLFSVGVVSSVLILWHVWVEDSDLLLESILLFAGSMTLFYFSYLIESANEKKVLKYHICKKIELEYGFIGQNILVDRLPISNQRFNGIWILRVVKWVLFFFYTLSILVSGVLLVKENGYSIASVAPFGFVFFAGAGSLFLEIFYATQKTDYRKLIGK